MQPSTNNPEDCLVFRTSPSPLRTLSSYLMVLILWRYKFERLSPRELFPSGSFYTREMISISTTLERQIDQYIKPIGRELKKWMEYHWERIFYDTDLSAGILRCLYHIVCYPDGNISYESTARNLIDKGALNEVQTYRIACLYCFEDTIRIMWPTTSKLKNLHIHIMKPHFNYWNHILANKSNPKDTALERTMIYTSSKHTRNWIAMLHYLKRLDTEEQTAIAIDLVKFSVTYALYLLPKLNATQQRKILTKHGVIVWHRFAKQLKYSGYAQQTWNHFKRFASNHQFFSIIKPTVDDGIFGLRANYGKNARIAALLYETWTEASFRLRSYIADNFARSVIGVLFEDKGKQMRLINRDARFLMAVLSQTSYEFRNDLWQKNWHKMVYNVPPSYLEQMLDLCVKDAADGAPMRQRLATNYRDLEHYCNESFDQGYYRDIDEFLKFCNADERKTTDLKRSVVMRRRDDGWALFLLRDVAKWNAFVEFVDNFYETSECAENYKANMILSTSTRRKMNEALSLGQLYDIRKFVEIILPCDRLMELKEDFIQYCRYSLLNGLCYNFNEANWQEFFVWCLGDDKQRVYQFRDSLPLDEIFEKSLHNCVCCDNPVAKMTTYECDFTKLDNFLKWCFAMPEEVNAYKLSRISEYDDMETLKTLLMVDNAEILNKTVEWFFSGDKGKIHKWMSSFSNKSSAFAELVGSFKKIF